MSGTIESKMPDIERKQKCPERVSTYLVRALFIIPGATILIALLFYSLGYLNLSHAVRHILAIFVYSVCIALPSILLLTRVSVRLAPRLPRAIVLIQALCLVAHGNGRLPGRSLRGLLRRP